jgi:acetyl esterase
MALDQATTALLEEMKASGLKPLQELTPAEARGRMAALGGDAPPGPDMLSVRHTRVRASGGFVPVRVLIPVDQPRGVIVYYHGGGWVIGSRQRDQPGIALPSRQSSGLNDRESGCDGALTGSSPRT